MKSIDITEKLNFEEKPKLIIKGESYPINNDAVSMLKIMQLSSGDVTANDFIGMYEILFDKETRDKIDKLKLNFKDFQTLIETATQLVTDFTMGEQ